MEPIYCKPKHIAKQRSSVSDITIVILPRFLVWCGVVWCAWHTDADGGLVVAENNLDEAYAGGDQSTAANFYHTWGQRVRDTKAKNRTGQDRTGKDKRNTLSRKQVPTQSLPYLDVARSPVV